MSRKWQLFSADEDMQVRERIPVKEISSLSNRLGVQDISNAKINNSFLTQVVRKPRSRGALLDLTLTNKEELVRDLKIRDKLGYRDLEIVMRFLSECKRDKKVTASSWHGLMKRKPCLTDLMAFHNEVTGLVYVHTIGKKDWEVTTQSNDQRKTRFLVYVIDSRNVYLA
ncbi:serine threonine-protein phosphatase 2b catalytic subunit alpha isoform [Limosa lapponica baueri]|uniref:Serine threonine-protein phosphatase 2b catalytic subunit alpha isoform n=1 Tax=Limosa lapponica baueri TaxID=1758121 RepID=A0A2I0UIY8_LIMLA|nr:serine threonine-protein phosphatase 2b catalytic subunit alpha isoform [Limosa lapponica baueri]